MTHFYEKNIVDIKNEYTTFLIDILSPLIYEGILSIYNNAIQYEHKYSHTTLNNPDIVNPGVIALFKYFLKGVPNLNNHIIDRELIRIRDNSKYADIFESLFKSVIKSNIILLTFNASGKKCKLVDDKLHEKIDIRLFIHKCYIVCAEQFYNFPELFSCTDKHSSLHKEKINLIIKNEILHAIRLMLPIKLIINEYLKNDYISDNIDYDNNNQLLHIKNMLHDDNNNNINSYDDGTKHNILISESSSNYDLDELNNNIKDLDNLIYDRPILETSDDSHVSISSNNTHVPSNIDLKNSPLSQHPTIPPTHLTLNNLTKDNLIKHIPINDNPIQNNLTKDNFISLTSKKKNNYNIDIVHDKITL